jgi:Asp-tRNA(Asn)/Glu-tRNA(Gln) amidotransferase A subunit family amidase
MQLLEPGFTVHSVEPVRVGVLQVDAHPWIAAALDRALRTAEWEVSTLELPEWEEATLGAGLLLVAEAWACDGGLVARHPDKIGTDVLNRLRVGASFDAATVASARHTRQRWCARLGAVFETVDVVATPTLTVFPPGFDHADDLLMARCTLPVNLAGVPAVVLPVPTPGPLPASIQLVGPAHSEERLLAAARTLEAAIATL